VWAIRARALNGLKRSEEALAAYEQTPAFGLKRPEVWDGTARALCALALDRQNAIY
jgi:hypothetical protein